MTLTLGSLFSGIGGLDLGLERAGLKVIWQSEIDPYCNKVLKKHWPKVPNYGDIKQFDWRTVERPNVICGGYPCQPFSVAGHRRGTNDPRHLWPWVRTAISELRPNYAILENVRGHLSMGGTAVIGDLAEIGYDAEWRVVSAAGMGAPHRRDRIIIVAYPNNTRSRTPEFNIDTHRPAQVQERQNVAQFRVSGRGANVADTDGQQLGERGFAQNVRQTHSVWKHHDRGQKEYDGWKWWQVEPDVGRVANGVPDRMDRLRGLGNAVVPQVAEYVGRLIVNAQ